MSKKEPINLLKSVERFFSHEKDHTILVCRFDFESPSFTVAIKPGHYTTFGQFMDAKKPMSLLQTVKSKDAAYLAAAEFLSDL